MWEDSPRWGAAGLVRTFFSGEIEAVLDGQTYALQAGDYWWSSAGSMHAFTNRSDAPVRWIETQVPQPPSRYQARFRNEWERVARGDGGRVRGRRLARRPAVK